MFMINGFKLGNNSDLLFILSCYFSIHLLNRVMQLSSVNGEKFKSFSKKMLGFLEGNYILFFEAHYF